ncbi:hypothetical protein QFZ94_000330 [Paraburkholderia sp. JPY465]|uniref:recombinase family protein n=1 Tax=Paraburkholderia sp. JPY465 TaxID=3042285 RepID=UPI003D1F173D
MNRTPYYSCFLTQADSARLCNAKIALFEPRPHQALLMEEFSSCGVQVVFLNHAIGTTPEESLLLQMQGMIAEYERAKIAERHRRGKLHGAKRGTVNVLSGAPYGYRYIGEVQSCVTHWEAP